MSERLSKRLSLSPSKVDDGATEPAAEVVDGKATLEEVLALDYKVRLLFTHTHHEKLVDKKERKEMVDKIKATLALADKIKAEDEDVGDEVRRQAEKLLAVIAGNDYLQDGKAKTLKECLQHGAACGWEMLEEEPWRAQVVAKAAKVGYQAAIQAVGEHKDLNEAIKKAPGTTSRWSFIPAGFKPPVKPKK